MNLKNKLAEDYAIKSANPEVPYATRFEQQAFIAGFEKAAELALIIFEKHLTFWQIRNELQELVDQKEEQN